MTRTSQHKIAIQASRTAYFARVVVSETDSELSVSDEVRDGDWDEAALAGARWALAVADSHSGVRVTSVLGTNVDTNPLLVAIATARAVFELVGFQPEPKLSSALKEAIRTSWDATQDAATEMERIGSTGP